MKPLPWLLALLLLARPLAAGELGVQGFLGFNHAEAGVYAQAQAFLGGDSVRIGAVWVQEQPHDYLTDQIQAAGLRFGGERYLTLAVGRFTRKYTDHEGTHEGRGTGAVLEYGGLVRDWLTLSLPVYYKTITEGDLRRRTLIDAVPHLGLRWGW